MKQKTRKTFAERFKITKKNKVIQRTCGQDHFNSKETGKTTRNKRRDHQISKSLQKTIKTAIGK